MSLPRYPEYKDSGVEWLGEVPGHWVELPLKAVASHNDDLMGETTDAEQEILYVDISSVDRAVGIVAKEAMSFAAAPSRARRKVKNGDVIVSTVRTYLRAIARIVEPEENLVVSTGFAVIRPTEQIFHGFLGHLLSANFFVDEVIAKSVGVSYPAINASDLVGIKVPVPPIEEQQTIAAFLDRETGKIDALIVEQRRLVELLAEKRQAVISHAVTKGLNPNAPMKDSGIEWLGEVPEHWTICLLKRAFRSVDYGISDSLDSEGEVAILRMGNIQNGKVVIENLKFTDSVDPYLLLQAGDLLYNRTNSLDLIGKVGMFIENEGEPVSFASYLVRLRTVEESIPDYFAYLLNTEGILGLARCNAFVAIGQCNLNPTRYGQITVAIPPQFEQDAIADFLDSETAKFDTLTFEANRAIALLQERRSALISAAVTGKIDVRAPLD